MSEMMYIQALVQAAREELVRDERVFVIGEDVQNGINGTTAGLFNEFGARRIVDAPISEEGYTGLAIGAAMAGLRPVVEYDINTLQYMAMDQLVNQAARLRYMTGGQVSIPLTITVLATGIGSTKLSSVGGQHSDAPWTMLAGVGIKVVVPTTPRDARGLYKAAVRCDDPVVLYEPTALYTAKGDVPDEDEVTPIGVARIARQGKDVTVVATGRLVVEAERAATRLAASSGLDVEVIDPRTIYPLDVETILASVRKTHRLVVADDDYRFAGFASAVAAIVAEHAWGDLHAPILRVTRPMVPVPYAAALVAEVSPTSEKVEVAVRAVAGERSEVRV